MHYHASYFLTHAGKIHWTARFEQLANRQTWVNCWFDTRRVEKTKALSNCWWSRNRDGQVRVLLAGELRLRHYYSFLSFDQRRFRDRPKTDCRIRLNSEALPRTLPFIYWRSQHRWYISYSLTLRKGQIDVKESDPIEKEETVMSFLAYVLSEMKNRHGHIKVNMTWYCGYRHTRNSYDGIAPTRCESVGNSWF